MLAFVRGSGGGYAERVVADDEWIFDLPAGVDYAEGAAFLTTRLGSEFVPRLREGTLTINTVRLAPTGFVASDMVTLLTETKGNAGD